MLLVLKNVLYRLTNKNILQQKNKENSCLAIFKFQDIHTTVDGGDFDVRSYQAIFCKTYLW